MAINLEYLRLFCATARLESVSRAAEEVHLSQPTVTKELRMLEEQIGMQLFLRHSRGVRLTVEGEYLYERVREAMARLLDMEQEAERIRQLECGTIRLSFNHGATRCAFQPILDEFQALHPRITMQYSTIPREFLIDSLHGGIIDLAFAERPGKNPIPSQAEKVREDIAEYSLGVFPDVFVAHSHRKELRDRTVSLSDLTECPLIFQRAEDEITQRYYEQYLMHRSGKQKDLFIEDTEAVFRILEIADYVAVIPEITMRAMAEKRAFFRLDITEEPFSHEYLLHYSRTRQPGFAAMKLVEFLAYHEPLRHEEITCSV